MLFASLHTMNMQNRGIKRGRDEYGGRGQQAPYPANPNFGGRGGRGGDGGRGTGAPFGGRGGGRDSGRGGGRGGGGGGRQQGGGGGGGGRGGRGNYGPSPHGFFKPSFVEDPWAPLIDQLVRSGTVHPNMKNEKVVPPSGKSTSFRGGLSTTAAHNHSSSTHSRPPPPPPTSAPSSTTPSSFIMHAAHPPPPPPVRDEFDDAADCIDLEGFPVGSSGLYMMDGEEGPSTVNTGSNMMISECTQSGKLLFDETLAMTMTMGSSVNDMVDDEDGKDDNADANEDGEQQRQPHDEVHEVTAQGEESRPSEGELE